MPLTGLLPTMAMALAATVVNRNAMTATTKMPIKAWLKLCTTPNQKNRKAQESSPPQFQSINSLVLILFNS